MRSFAPIACLLVMTLLAGCYKDKTDTTTYTVPFTVLNALATSFSDLLVVAGDNRTPFNKKAAVHFFSDDGYNITGLWYFGISGKEPALVQVYYRKDSTKPFFSKTISSVPGQRHNLMVTGTPEMPGYLYLHDQPQRPADSSTGIRFVNLVRNLPNICVNISGQPVGSEVADLPYLQASPFKLYNARTGQRSYIFEMVDKSTGEIVLSYPFTVVPFTNTNICLRGLKNDWPELQVTTVYQ
jgi:hypothetical protein